LGIVGQWERGDEPRAEHARHFPRCPFILDLPVGNVPSPAYVAADGPSSGAGQPRAASAGGSQSSTASATTGNSQLLQGFRDEVLPTLNQGFDVAGLGRREIRTNAVPERGK
jgi:hypothetical protein